MKRTTARNSARSRVPALIATVALAVGALGWVLLFAVPHATLQYRLDQMLCVRAPRTGACSNTFARELRWWGVPLVVDYLGWALAALVLVRAGRRFLALIPPIACVLLPPLYGSTEVGARAGGRFANAFWWIQPWATAHIAPPPWLGHPWLGALAGLSLVLLPAGARLVTRPRPAAVRPSHAEIAGALVVAAAIAAGAWLISRLVSPMHPIELGDTPSAIAVFALGLGLGWSSRWRLAGLILFPLALSGLAGQWLGQVVGNLPFAPFALADLSPSVAAGLEQVLPWIGLSLVAAWSPNLFPSLRARARGRLVVT